jgi:ubiquinone/menaquinone biosynthesis C-methylase UbiE
MDWKTFWDRPNAIYVNDRHRDAHYAGIAADIVALVPHAGAHVLDHGCGEALSADAVAAACGRLHLLDAAPSVREKLATRFRDARNVVVLAPEALWTVPDASLDLIVANSLLQYLSAEDFDRCLAEWRAKLAPTGRLVLADVIPPNVSPVTDALALLAFARSEGFLGAAITGLARTAVSPYAKVRSALGLAKYAEGEMLDRLRGAGFDAFRAERNMGHNPSRMTFIATHANGSRGTGA